MKKLELNQMTALEGGVNQRNCGLLGLGIVGGAISGGLSFGAGWAFAGACFIAAASSNCF